MTAPSQHGARPGDGAGANPYATSPQVSTAWSAHEATAPAYRTNHQVQPGWQQATSRRGIRAWVLVGVISVGFLVSGTALAAYFGAHLGLVTSLLALLFAAIPLGIVIPTFLWLDRFEAEPTRYLVFAFLWGALVAAALAAVFNTSALLVFRGSTDPAAALQTTAVVVAPFVEEGLKGLLVLVVWWFLRREFDGVTDGMVYAGICAAGFAFTENISYLGEAYSEGGGPILAGTFLVRCVLSPFAHPIFTIFTGIGIGIAATSRRGPVKVVAPVIGYLLAVLAHALWNLSAMAGGEGLLTIYVLVEVPIFIGFVVLVVWTRRREGRLIGRFLSPYAAAGWLSPSEVSMLASMGRRREARIWARANAGRPGLAAMRAFQDAASELALLRRRMFTSGVDDKALTSERRLLDALVQRRREFIGLPMA